MRKLLPLILLLAVAAAQLAVPASMIAHHEAARSEGVPLKFRTGIYDPYDPFRGRYVRLRFELEQTPNMQIPIQEETSADQEYHGRQHLYVVFEPDTDGFATIKAISPEKPEAGLYLRLPCQIYNHKVTRIGLPFDRYFMNEKAAPEAERLYSEAIRAASSGRARNEAWSDDNYALVRILDGTAALEELVVDDQPIEHLLEELAEPTGDTAS